MKSWDFLFPQKLRGGDAGEMLEQVGEVMGEQGFHRLFFPFHLLSSFISRVRVVPLPTI